MKKPNSSTIPVTVIGGFLGAGKTTFLNRILESGAERFAVLVNDFGEINIDASLIARHDGATMTLTNGCICCSMGDGFFETLIDVIDGDTPFDHIVIEASGVGDPWRIAEIALVENSLKLNALIVLADAKRICDQLADARISDIVKSQLARCDVVLLNKSDLVDPQDIDLARRAIAEAKAGPVRIVVTSRETMPSLASLVAPASRNGFKSEAVEPAGVDHDAQFKRWIYQRDGAFDRDQLSAAVKRLPDELLRLKGSCRVSGEAAQVVFQMVGQSWALCAPPPDHASTQRDITLVGVGTAGLPSSDDLDSILDQALVPRGAGEDSVQRFGFTKVGRV